MRRQGGQGREVKNNYCPISSSQITECEIQQRRA